MADRALSFDMGNVVPQVLRLKRVGWARIERKVRRMALVDGDVYVVTDPVFVGPPRAIGGDHVVIPRLTWKVAFEPRARSVSAWSCTNIAEYVCHSVSLRSIAVVAHESPLPTLPVR